jgi:hypothetical protein
MNQGVFNNHMRAAMLRVVTYLKQKKIITTSNSIKRKQMIRLFAEEHRLTVERNTNKWLVDLYLSGVCIDCCQAEPGFYNSPEWLKLRTEVLLVYDSVCMKCGSTDHIHVDHIKPRSKFPHLELDFDNMQVLCRTCNLEKSNRTFIDYRKSTQPFPAVSV